MHNILVIDDEKSISEVLCHALMRFGFNVDTAQNGLEGITKFDEAPFDLVITDICMSGLDGIGVVRHIRNSLRRSTPVIGISGTPRLLQEGDFDAVLPKPFSIMALTNTVRNLTGTVFN